MMDYRQLMYEDHLQTIHRLQQELNERSIFEEYLMDKLSVSSNYNTNWKDISLLPEEQ